MWCINLILLLIVASVGFSQTIFFGGLFQDAEDEEAFKFAVHYANIAYQEYGVSFKALIPDQDDPRQNGPFKAKTSTCSLISQQALVIFGPKDPEEISIVQSICDYKDIAHVVTRWMFNMSEHSIINFYPGSSYLTQAYISIIELAQWKSFTLFYEDDESMLRLGDLLNLAKNKDIIVSLKQLDEVGDEIYRTTLKEALQSGERNYVIDCKIEILADVLTQAQQVGLITTNYNIFITNLDLQSIDLEPFQYSGANITGIRLYDPYNEVIKERDDTKKDSPHENFNFEKIKTETALVFDAVSMLAKIISTKLSFEEIESGEINCDSKKSSRHGYTIANSVKTSKSRGLTGLIEFDGKGFRNNFNLEVIEIRDGGAFKVGNWNSTKGLRMSRPGITDLDEDVESLRNKTFKIITCLTDPYCMLKETPEQLFGNDRFEGYAIDLISELSKMEGFNYTFVIREDKMNGKKDPKTGEWSGMIGDVRDGTADLAITDLTITAERVEAVDFTSPFMNLGISILAQKPKNAPPSFFSFADPLALDTWLMLALAYIIVSLSIFIMARFCQDEWTNPYPCIEEPEYLINQFSLPNAGWFTVGALMQQGTELGPIAISTRVVSGMWWFFVLIMVSSYTANLAAFLATENPIHLFTDAASLVANKEKHNLRFGAKASGATESFFKGKEDAVYKKIAEHMEKHKEDMVSDNKEGVQLAIQYNYAFFMESTSIEYETQRHCELQQYGKPLDDKGYGIAMRRNSSYRTKLSTAILKLQSNGELANLKRKWWEEKKGGGKCSAPVEDETPPLGVQNVEGVFYVTIVGTILALLLVIVQMLLHTYKMSLKAKISFKEALRIEMRAFMNFSSDVKPTLKKSSKSASKSSKETGISNNNFTAPPFGFVPIITKQELELDNQ